MMISYALIKLTNCGLYAKALERWHNLPSINRLQWTDYRPFFIQEYERMLREGGDPSIQQEGYGSAFMGIDEDGESIVESIVKYAERATPADAKMTEMESRLSSIESAPPSSVFYPSAIPSAAATIPSSTANHCCATARDLHAKAPATASTTAMPTVKVQEKEDTKELSGLHATGDAIWTEPQRVPTSTGPINRRPSSRWNLLKPPKNISQSVLLFLNHPVTHCQKQKQGHIPNLLRDEAHNYRGICMVTQHKCLPDGTGEGKGWSLAQNLEKAKITMQKQAEWKQQHPPTKLSPAGIPMAKVTWRGDY